MNSASYFLIWRNKVLLLAIPGINGRNVYFYTALIPSSFLDKFDRPSQFSRSCAVLVSYYRIPLISPEMLPRKLQRILSITDEQ